MNFTQLAPVGGTNHDGCELLSFSLSLTSFTQQALDFIGDAVDSLDEENYV